MNVKFKWKWTSKWIDNVELRHYYILIVEYSGEGLSAGHNQELETLKCLKLFYMLLWLILWWFVKHI